MLLKNCRLIPYLTEGCELELADVLIAGDKISAIRPTGFDFGIVAPDETMDLCGKTLMPGFIELHTHLCYYIYNSYEIAAMDPGHTMFHTYEFAKEYLNQGYTTIRDCGSTHNAVVCVRDAINEGIVPGPRLIASGLILTPTETGNETFGGLYAEADGADEMRKAVRVELQKGNDFIKLMASGAFMNAGGDPGAQITTEEEIRAAVDAAAMKNKYVAAHAHGAGSIRAAIHAGVRTVEHGTFIDDEGIELLLKSNRTYMVPTAAIGLYSLESSGALVSEEFYGKTLRYREAEQKSVTAAYDAGLKFGFGSDIDMAALKSHIGYEFRARREYYNFRDKDILLQATKYNAEIAGIDDVTGTVKEGKLADLVIVDGKPDEDIYVLTKPVEHVICRGVLYR